MPLLTTREVSRGVIDMSSVASFTTSHRVVGARKLVKMAAVLL